MSSARIHAVYINFASRVCKDSRSFRPKSSHSKKYGMCERTSSNDERKERLTDFQMIVNLEARYLHILLEYWKLM